MSIIKELNAWLLKSPKLGASADCDRRTLETYVQDGESLLDRLPIKCERSPDQTVYARSIHTQSRLLRRKFMTLHCDWLYGVITQNLTAHKSLRDLSFSAARFCPGLVPTESQIAIERKHSQSDKEGREIDQGIFFQELLRRPSIGAHLMRSMLRPTKRAYELSSQFRNCSRLDLGSVVLEREGHSAHLTINNAHCLNAEDDSLIEDMETAVDLVLLDESVRVGVVRGGLMTHPRYKGRRVFSAGINLRDLHAGQISFIDFLLRREFGYINKLIHGLQVENINGTPFHPLANQKPWIAVVDSFAIGGGAQLLLAFDRVIAANDSYFSLPAADEGIIPGFANLRLNRLIGSRMTRQIILCGRKVEAYEPEAKLIFDEIVEPAQLEATIDRNIQQLSSPAVIANRHMINIAEEPIESMLRYSSEFALLQAERLYSQDVLEKIRYKWGKASS